MNRNEDDPQGCIHCVQASERRIEKIVVSGKRQVHPQLQTLEAKNTIIGSRNDPLSIQNAVADAENRIL